MSAFEPRHSHVKSGCRRAAEPATTAFWKISEPCRCLNLDTATSRMALPSHVEIQIIWIKCKFVRNGVQIECPPNRGEIIIEYRNSRMGNMMTKEYVTNNIHGVYRRHWNSRMQPGRCRGA
ncbi:hypothetical protein B0H14DRAFT_2569948 [Mycena olivaceomarginata]|nr:hypothetical protein B0H14DRAFT_2569948 [Mycena olivaceomarginata]